MRGAGGLIQVALLRALTTVQLDRFRMDAAENKQVNNRSGGLCEQR
jgi:hypothetical protein